MLEELNHLETRFIELLNQRETLRFSTAHQEDNADVKAVQVGAAVFFCLQKGVLGVLNLLTPPLGNFTWTTQEELDSVMRECRRIRVRLGGIEQSLVALEKPVAQQVKGSSS